ncbi:unnamed protein product [Cyclocybe aegerita]|uniref:Aminoglycoside phosphotransferase domain-containing protein n=1 Tax=Cyclocybe aegerita TaxID=1973307 RepID=A0A8S0XIX8_CYCAE|nr:unnamed protein product [Cyclocybe aegerita]
MFSLVYKAKTFLLSVIFESISTFLVMRGSYGRVQSLPFGLILKLSELTVPEEAKVVRFVSAHTSIPLPHIVASSTGFWNHYMLMKRVDGETLEYAWRTLSSEQRSNVLEQLRTMVEQLRSIPAPQDLQISALENAPCLDGRVAGRRTFGPFKTVAEFHDHLLEVSKYYDERNLGTIRSQMSDDCRIVFTHGDLAARNIFVKGDKVVAIIDWEHAGWYPEYWEYVKAKYTHDMDEDWDQAIRDMIPGDYEKEWKLDKNLSDRIVGAL